MPSDWGLSEVNVVGVTGNGIAAGDAVGVGRDVEVTGTVVGLTGGVHRETIGPDHHGDSACHRVAFGRFGERDRWAVVVGAGPRAQPSR